MTDGDRPQDVGRSHRRKGAPSPETAELLTAYQAAMRSELRDVLAELKGSVTPTGLLDSEFTTAEVRTRPPIAERVRLWDLAIKIGRELGSAIDADPVPVASAPAGPRGRRRKLDYG